MTEDRVEPSDDRDGRRRRGAIVLVLLVVVVVGGLLVDAKASSELDASRSRLEADLEQAFAGTTLAEVEPLSQRSNIGDARPLDDFLARADARWSVFTGTSTGYRAVFEYDAWGRSGRLEVRWTASGVTIGSP